MRFFRQLSEVFSSASRDLAEAIVETLRKALFTLADWFCLQSTVHAFLKKVRNAFIRYSRDLDFGN